MSEEARAPEEGGEAGKGASGVDCAGAETVGEDTAGAETLGTADWVFATGGA